MDYTQEEKNAMKNAEKEAQEKEDKLRKIIEKELKRAYYSGVKIGVLSTSKIVIEKLENTSKPLMERISSVKKFCNVSIKNKGFLSSENKPSEALWHVPVNTAPQEDEGTVVFNDMQNIDEGKND